MSSTTKNSWTRIKKRSKRRNYNNCKYNGESNECGLYHNHLNFQGESFGELALLENKPRAATIICNDECHFAVLDKKPFDVILSYIKFI